MPKCNNLKIVLTYLLQPYPPYNPVPQVSRLLASGHAQTGQQLTSLAAQDGTTNSATAPAAPCRRGFYGRPPVCDEGEGQLVPGGLLTALPPTINIGSIQPGGGGVVVKDEVEAGQLTGSSNLPAAVLAAGAADGAVGAGENGGVGGGGGAGVMGGVSMEVLAAVALLHGEGDGMEVDQGGGDMGGMDAEAAARAGVADFITVAPPPGSPQAEAPPAPEQPPSTTHNPPVPARALPARPAPPAPVYPSAFTPHPRPAAPHDAYHSAAPQQQQQLVPADGPQPAERRLALPAWAEDWPGVADLMAWVGCAPGSGGDDGPVRGCSLALPPGAPALTSPTSVLVELAQVNGCAVGGGIWNAD